MSSGPEIRINIESQDIFVHPTQNNLLVEGRFVKNYNTAYTNADLVNYGFMYLFKSICYEMFGEQIEYMKDPAIETTTVWRDVDYTRQSTSSISKRIMYGS